MSSCSLSNLGGVFDRVATILVGPDAVTDPVTGRIITPLPHDIAQLLTSPHLNYNHSFFVSVIVISLLLYSSLLSPSLYHPFLFLIISILGNAVYPWRLHAYCCVNWEWRAQILICFGSHSNYSGSCRVPSDILGWRMARLAWFSHNQGIAHPWSLNGGLKMLR